MGYHVELVASPSRPIGWAELALAGEALGWYADEKEQELRLEPEGKLVARVVLSDGEAWIKTPDDVALTAVIALAEKMGLRARGDEFESYRSLNEWYIHPDDEMLRARPPTLAASPSAQRLLRQRQMINFAKLAVLVVMFLGFAIKAWKEFQ